MSQTFKPHKITIKNKVPGTILTGLNAQVLLDGKPINGITFMKVELKPGKVAKIILELVSDVEIVDTIFEDIALK